jgi:hypothetical protein
MSESTDKLRKKAPCKICGSRMIEFHRKIEQLYDSGMDKMTVYCYCVSCGYKGPSVTNRFEDTDHARDVAYNMWNNAMEKK